MARVPLNIDLTDNAGNVVAGATATVKTTAGANAVLYVARTGGVNAPNPLVMDANGRAQCWVDRGLYQIVYGGGITRTPDWWAAGATDNAEIDSAWLPALAALIADDGLTAQKLDPATVRAILGLNSTGQVRRGKSIIATAESRTSVSYGLMTTPDRVSSVILPTDGLIRVRYHATWQEAVAGAARAAIFIGAPQLKVVSDQGVAQPVTQAAATNAGAVTNTDRLLLSTPGGLVSSNGGASADVTTGEALAAQLGTANSNFAYEINGTLVALTAAPALLGGVCEIFAAAGTYDVSVAFKSSSGSLTVKNRKLLVEAISFG